MFLFSTRVMDAWSINNQQIIAFLKYVSRCSGVGNYCWMSIKYDLQKTDSLSLWNHYCIFYMFSVSINALECFLFFHILGTISISSWKWKLVRPPGIRNREQKFPLSWDSTGDAPPSLFYIPLLIGLFQNISYKAWLSILWANED